MALDALVQEQNQLPHTDVCTGQAAQCLGLRLTHAESSHRHSQAAENFLCGPPQAHPPPPPPTATAATLHTAFVIKRRGPKARTQLEFTRSTRWPLHDRRCRPAAWQIFTNGSHQAATKRLCRVVL